MIIRNFTFRNGTTTVSNIIKETCIALKEVLTDKFVKPPCCETDWLEIGRDLEEIWNLPNVVDALDEKHIQIDAPPNSGTLFHQYKPFFSIVLETGGSAFKASLTIFPTRSSAVLFLL